MPETAVSVRREQGTSAIEVLLVNVATALVDDTKSISVVTKVSDRGTTIVLVVARADLGKVIGKQGRTARSIRLLLQAASVSLGQTLLLDIQAA